ncbi:hypothetical protein WDU94_013695 [Cyamophila willieti]
MTIEQEAWEEEVAKEKEQMKRMKQQLEKIRDNLLTEQENFGIERLKLATEKSKIDVLLKLNSGVDLIQSKAEAESMMQVAKATIASVKETKEKLQDEKARLMDMEQEVTLRERMADKMIKMSEQKQNEGLNALEEAKRLEATFKHKSDAIQQQLAELSIREHKLTKVSFTANSLDIQLSPTPASVAQWSERQPVEQTSYQPVSVWFLYLCYQKVKEKLFAYLPEVEQTSYQPTIIDPRSIITKLRAEKDIEND